MGGVAKGGQSPPHEMHQSFVSCERLAHAGGASHGGVIASPPPSVGRSFVLHERPAHLMGVDYPPLQPPAPAFGRSFVAAPFFRAMRKNGPHWGGLQRGGSHPPMRCTRLSCNTKDGPTLGGQLSCACGMVEGCCGALAAPRRGACFYRVNTWTPLPFFQ